VFVLGLAVAVGGQLFNCAAVVHHGRILGFVPKEKLPTYNVFYEGRTFSRGGPALTLDAGGIPLGDYVFGFDFGLVAVEVCEDAWSPDGPMRRRCYSGAEIVVNVSASPYRMGIDATRREMLATRAADTQALLVYANAVGGQDGLIYDGGGFIFQNGRRVLEAPDSRGWVWWTWIAPGGCASRTPPGAATAKTTASAGRPSPSSSATGARQIARGWATRRQRAAVSSCPPAARPSPTRATRRSTISSKRSRWA
jgi:predicted amidohydrolase